MSVPAPPSVAFVVIGRNEGDRLEECLRSVLSASPRVVYADSGSTDGSAKRARALGVHVIELTPSKPLNASRGRSEGFAAVQDRFPEAAFVQFLDGDCVLQPGWVEVALDFIEVRPTVAVVCGRRFEKNPAASFYNRMADEEWNTPIGRADACGGDSLMRIAALNEVGGFNPGLMASEEPELCSRFRANGWDIWRLDAPMTEHDAAIFRFGQWWRRTVRSGYGYAQAWACSGRLPSRVNQPLLRRAFLWAIILPALAGAAVVISGRAEFLAALALAYAVQIARIRAARRDRSLYAWKASAMLVLAKFPEAIGALKYFLGRRSHNIADYKSVAR